MNTRVFTSHEQNGQRPAARVLNNVKGMAIGEQLQWFKGERKHDDR